MRNFNITAGTPAFAIHCFRSEDSEKGSISRHQTIRVENADLVAARQINELKIK